MGITTLKSVHITSGALAQLVEHIVHIDGVTGSSPVQTTNTRSIERVFSYKYREDKDEII